MTSHGILKSIHKNASSLEERYGNELANGRIPENLPLTVIAKWDNLLKSGNESRLRKRLGLFGLTKEKIQSQYHLYRQEWDDPSGWIHQFSKVLDKYHSGLTADRNQIYKEGKAIPFIEVLFPFIEYVDHGLISLKLDMISGKIRQDVHDHLLEELVQISQDCFYESFNKYRQAHSSDQANSIYDRFIGTMYQGKIIDFFMEYPVLARLMTITCDNWILAFKNLFDHLTADWSSINECFFNGSLIGNPQHLEAAITTSHGREGKVFILRFEGKRNLVYKPRHSILEDVFNGIISWLGDHNAEMDLRHVKVLNRKSHSWQEYIPYTSCSSKSEVAEYYRNVGIYAGILQILGSRDYHFGNVRAFGKYPCIIDHETLFSPEFSFHQDSLNKPKGKSRPIKSPHIADGSFIMQSSGLADPDAKTITGVFDQEFPLKVKKISNINRDNMKLGVQIRKWKGDNIPKLKGKRINPYEYISEIRKGYREILDFLIENQAGWIKKIDGITLNYSLMNRLLIRPTLNYIELRRESTDPKYLKGGLERSLLFEVLAKKILESEIDNDSAFILLREKEMMEENLIPWFHCPMNGKEIEPMQMPSNLIKRTSKEVFLDYSGFLKEPGFKAEQLKIFDKVMPVVQPH